MKILKQLALIIAFTLIGNLISYGLSFTPVNFPGSLIGMILLFIFLLTGIVKIDSIHEVGQFFIDNMGIFFVPASIAILKQLQLISEIWWKLLIIILGAFLISFTATYYAVKLTLYLQQRHREKKEQKKEEAES